jgi:hypothetical protein
MSWDVMIFNIRGVCPSSLEELEERDCMPLGPAPEVRQQISTLLPGVDWSDPTWGIYVNDELSIEFSVGTDDPVTDMMLHVRGTGDALGAIMAIVCPTGWSALDCSTSDFLDAENPSAAGWQGFQAYRDKIVGDDRDASGG